MDIINLGILAHVDAGKTTLTECMLYQSGNISQMGRVDNGTTVTDSLELEKKRGMTIKSSVVSFFWNNVKINLIDTPGHFDFVSEVESALHILDVVVLVISAKEGVQSQTRLIFRKLQEIKIPTIIYINKLDRVGVDYDDLMDELKIQLSSKIIELQKYHGIGKKEVRIENLNFEDECIQNQLLISSDALMKKYDELNDIASEDYENEFVQMVRSGELYPVLGGVALKNQGVTEVMDLLTEIMSGITPKTDKLSAYVYKIDHDKVGHKRIFFRVFSGVINVRKTIEIYADEPQKILVRNLSSFDKNKIVTTKSVGSGDIGIIFDEDQLQVGSIIGEAYDRIGKVKINSPMLQTSIRAKDENERYKLLDALTLLSQEDPQLKFEINRITDDIKIWVFGPLQMEVIEDMLKNRFGINICNTQLEIVYKEHPLKAGYCSIRIGDLTNPYNAGAVFRIEPLPLGSGFQYENLVSYGYLEKPFQNAVMDGIKIGLRQGINGHEVIDVKVTFLEADYDSVLGTPADFRKLIPIIIHNALEDAGVELLEPWQNFSVVVPKQWDKVVLKDICKMKARILEYYYGKNETGFIGKAVLRDIVNYESVLNTFTSGKGVFTQDFYKFLPMKESVEVLMEKY